MTNFCAGVGWGGLSGVFCVLFKGKCCAFFAARFSGDLSYVFQKFAPKILFRTLLGKIVGCELVLGTFYRTLSGISIWKSLQLCSKNPAAESSLFVSLAFLKFFSFKGRLCTEFCGEDFGGIMVRFSGLGILVGV